MTNELGMTLPTDEGQIFGLLEDDDGIADPEIDVGFLRDVELFLTQLAPPPRQAIADAALVERGEEVFAEVGCADCHLPSLEGPEGPVPLYSDLLLHEVLPEDAVGIADGTATMREFRTAPLWGISTSAPYMHHGKAETLPAAIRTHAGEAAASRDAFEALGTADQDALIGFLETL